MESRNNPGCVSGEIVAELGKQRQVATTTVATALHVDQRRDRRDRAFRSTSGACQGRGQHSMRVPVGMPRHAESSPVRTVRLPVLMRQMPPRQRSLMLTSIELNAESVLLGVGPAAPDALSQSSSDRVAEPGEIRTVPGVIPASMVRLAQTGHARSYARPLLSSARRAAGHESVFLRQEAIRERDAADGAGKVKREQRKVG